MKDPEFNLLPSRCLIGAATFNYFLNKANRNDDLTDRHLYAQHFQNLAPNHCHYAAEASDYPSVLSYIHPFYVCIIIYD